VIDYIKLKLNLSDRCTSTVNLYFDVCGFFLFFLLGCCFLMVVDFVVFVAVFLFLLCFINCYSNYLNVLSEILFVYTRHR